MTRGQFIMRRSAMAGVEAVEAATRHAFPRHTHQQFGIGVIHQGAQKSASGRGMVEAGPGDVITVNPNEVHDGLPIGEAGRSWRILYFEPELIAQATSDIHQGQSAPQELSHPVMTNASTAGLFSRLFAAMTAGGSDDEDLRREELLLRLVARLFQERPSPAPVPAAIRRALALIDEEPARPLTLSDLARESGLGRFQVLRGINRATGLTAHAYLMQRRVDLARRLIAGGSRLADAAAASGFADQSHMTRSFVHKYGISPGAYAAAVA
jgi:AraC-like DNA-binding protein